MLTEQRYEQILKLLEKEGSITVTEVKELLNISESTVRRDITALHNAGKLVKVFGGAVASDHVVTPQEPTVAQKITVHVSEKQRIAEYAAGLIGQGEFIYLDAGTTTGWMLEYIREPRATYITNAFSHAKRLSEKGFHVILIGGELKGSTEAIVGAEAVLNIQKYHFSKGFFGTNGIDQKMAFTTPDINEALVKQVAMRNTQAENRYVLTTSDKFDKIYAVTFSGFEGSVILTEKMPGESFWKNVNIQCV